MSTKIYNAYRVKMGVNIWDLVTDWQKLGRERSIAAIKNQHLEFARNIEPDNEEYKTCCFSLQNDPYYMSEDIAKMAAKSEVASKFMVEGAKKEYVTFLRGYFNYDVSITFRELNGRYYVQCYCDMMLRHVLDFVPEDSRVEDYHFQNSTEGPDNVTEDEWREREKIWDDIYDRENGRFRYLALDIMNLRDALFEIHEADRDLYYKIKKGEVVV